MKLSKIIFAILIISNIIGVTFVAKNRYLELQLKEEEVLKVHSELFKRTLEHEIMVTEIVEEVLEINNGTILEEDFYSLAGVLAKNSVSSTVAYIPDGIIKYIYPPERGKHIVGNNVFESKNDKVDSTRARDNNEIIVSGPYILFQKTLGLIVRNPVFYKDKFWGLVTVAIIADQLFAHVGFDSLELQGYEYELAANDLIAKTSLNYEPKYAVSEKINVGTSSWTLSVYAKDKTDVVASDAMFWFLIFLFLNFILYYLIQRFELAKEKLTKKLECDNLTGAYNRLKLQKFYDENKDLEFALFFIDLNKFKPVNDNYGHKVGDKLLKAYVERLKNEMQAGTMTARLGGDEFVVLTPNVKDEILVQTIKSKLIKLSELEFLIDDLHIEISASIGCVLSSEADSLEGLLTIADEKMYAEKGKRAR